MICQIKEIWASAHSLHLVKLSLGSNPRLCLHEASFVRYFAPLLLFVHTGLMAQFATSQPPLITIVSNWSDQQEP